MELLAFLQDPEPARFDLGIGTVDLGTYVGITIAASFLVWAIGKLGGIKKLIDGKEEWIVLALCLALGNLGMFLLGRFPEVDPISHQIYLVGAAVTAWVGYDKLILRPSKKSAEKENGNGGDL